VGASLAAPLTELENYLQKGRGYLLPVDWHEVGNDQYTLMKPNANHLDEWLRVTAKLPQWQVYLPEELT